ncbi:MAG: glycosyltransferase [Chitinophagaceae bacterium]|nr:MAG: glycosyltransferase [Chitinophagaceae bacterium]
MKGYTTINSFYDTGEEAAYRMKLLKLTQTQVDKVFIDNNFGRSNYIKNGIQNAGKLVYIPNGIETEEEHVFDKQLEAKIHQQISLAANEKIWLNVSRFARQKDHETLVEAFALLVKESPANKLILIGDGGLVPQITSLVKEKGLEAHIFYLGRINDIYTLCTMSHFYACSSYYEGMPIIIMQAMLYKLPIVSTAVGAIPDLISDGLSGYTCVSKNPVALCDAMKKMLMAGPAKQEAMGEEACRTIKNEFSTARLGHTYLANYKTVISGV